MTLPVIQYDEWQEEICRVKGDGLVCPDCGCGNIKSHGITYRCYECGRRWRKVYRPKVRLGEGKTCPRCQGSHVISRGDGWSCNDCHARWLKC